MRGVRNRPLCVVSAGGPRRNGTFHSQCFDTKTPDRRSYRVFTANVLTRLSQPMFKIIHIAQLKRFTCGLPAYGSSRHGVRLARWVARSELRRLPRAICICTVDWPTERTRKRKVPAQATDECANVWRSSFL